MVVLKLVVEIVVDQIPIEYYSYLMSGTPGSIGNFPETQTQRFLVCGWTAKQLSTQAEASCGPAAT